MGASDPITPVPQPEQPVPVQALDYRTPPPSASRRTLVIVLVLIGVGLIAATLMLFFVRTATVVVATPAIVATPVPPPAPTLTVQDYEQQRRKDAYDEYLSYTARPSTVVYDEDTARASKLLTAQPQKHRQTSTGSIDPSWASSFDRPIIQISPGDIPGMQPFVDHANPQDRTTLFVGKLRSPNGNARLVFLDMRITLTGHRSGGKSSKDANASPEYEARIDRKLEYRIYDAGATDGYPGQLRIGKSLTVRTSADAIPIRWIDGSLRADRPTNSALQIFAGMLDPKDPSHCTVDYDFGGQRGSIDVYLTDDDFLRVLPQTGRVAGGNWEVGAAPAAGESVERPATQPAP
jgi:hypothetical protein